MKKRHKRRRSLSLLLLFLLSAALPFLTACQAAAEPELTVQPYNSFDRTLVVATDDDYWPYVYYDENGQLTGHDIELITLVANLMKVNLEIH